MRLSGVFDSRYSDRSSGSEGPNALDIDDIGGYAAPLDDDRVRAEERRGVGHPFDYNADHAGTADADTAATVSIDVDAPAAAVDDAPRATVVAVESDTSEVSGVSEVADSGAEPTEAAQIDHRA
jgi:hypothetical protein